MFRILSFLLAVLMLPIVSFSESDIIDLDPVVVTGTVLPLPASEAVSDVDLLQGEDKYKRQTANLGKTLDFLPGISSMNTGSGVGLPVIRGLSGNRIRVMQDGSGVNYQQFGVRHPPNIDPLLSGRIEVVRGVSSILYGSDAFGGAINAISPEIPYSDGATPNLPGQLVVGYDDGNALQTAALQVAYGGEKFGLVAGVVYRNAGNLKVPDVETWNGPGSTGQASDIPRFSGELDFTDYLQKNGMIKAGFRNGLSEFSFRYERWDHENNYLLPTGKGIGVDLENNQFQAQGIGVFENDWSWKAIYTWNQNLRRANPAGVALPVVENDVDLERASHTLRGEVSFGEWQQDVSGTFGLEVISEEQESKGTTGLTPGGQIENFAGFAITRYAMNAWTFEAGLRFDHRSQEADPALTADSGLLEERVDPVSGNPVEVDLENSYDVMTASVGLLYDFSDSFAVAANLNRGFRVPDFFELYADGVHGGVAAYQFGYADLDAETSFGGDLQARWRSEKLDWTATIYTSLISDYIYLADTGSTHAGSGNPIFKVGQADSSLNGGDFSLTYRATEWMDANFVYERVRGEFDSGGDLPLLPADQFQVELIFHKGSFWVFERAELRVGVRHVYAKDAAGFLEPFSQFDRNPNFGTASTDAYTLYDIAVSAKVGLASFDLAIENISDEAYRDFLDTYKGYALSPGRNVSLRVGLDF